MVCVRKMAKLVLYDVVNQRDFASQQVDSQADCISFGIDAAPSCEHVFYRNVHTLLDKIRKLGQYFFRALRKNNFCVSIHPEYKKNFSLAEIRTLGHMERKYIIVKDGISVSRLIHPKQHFFSETPKRIAVLIVCWIMKPAFAVYIFKVRKYECIIVLHKLIDAALRRMIGCGNDHF